MKNAIIRSFLLCIAIVLSLYITTHLSVSEWKSDMITNHPAKWSRYINLQARISLENDRLNAMSKGARSKMHKVATCGNTYEFEETIYFIYDYLQYYRYNCMVALSLMVLSLFLLFEIVIFGSRSPVACFLNNSWIDAATLPRVGVSVAVIAFFAGFFMLNNEKTVAGETYDMKNYVIDMSKSNYDTDTPDISDTLFYHDLTVRTHRSTKLPW